MPEEAVGVAFFRGDRLLGLGLFDRHSTLRFFWNTLVDSYGLLELGRPVDADEPDISPDAAAVHGVLDEASGGTWEPFDSPGDGADHRLDHTRWTGSTLVWEDRVVVHLQLFPRDADQGGSRHRPRIRRSYLQR